MKFTEMKLNIKWIFTSLVFLVIIFLMTTENVFAQIGTNANLQGQAKESCQGNPWCWSSAYLTNGEFVYYGVRISIYDSSGDKISNTLDFAPKNYNPSMFGNVKYAPGKKTKLEYIDSSVTTYGSWSSADAGNLIDGQIVIEDLFPDIGNSSNVFSEKLHMPDQESIINVLGEYDDEFFDSGSYTIAGLFETAETAAKYYIVIEPITILGYTNNGITTRYYGTYAELFNIYQSLKSNPDFISVRSLFQNDGAGADRKLALSIYLDGEIGGTGSMQSTLSNLESRASTDTINNKYGIGVMWLGDYKGNTSTPSNCTVSSEVNPCDGSITYEYKNCVTDSAHEVDYSGTNICKITCDEKYHIESWYFKNVFQKVQTDLSTGTLAGTYASVNDFRVYHKKQCRYTEDLGTLHSMINSDISNNCYYEESYSYECGVGTSSETCHGSRIVEVPGCVNEYRTIETAKEQQCYDLENTYYSMDNTSAANSDFVSQKDLTLNTGFSEYTLKPTLEKQVTFPTEPSLGRFYFHNTFKYEVEESINQFIGMLEVHQTSGDNITGIYNNGNSMISTPINAKGGTYNYSVNYVNALNDTFKRIMQNNGINFNNVTSASCPYSLIDRNIKTYCEPENCGDPDDDFSVPDIRMVFRPIDLSTPFPGKFFSGIQRKAGPNWSEENIKTYITDTADTVYSGDPIYVIDLDADDIRTIREYNDTHDYDDFTLECTEGKGTECLSVFLRDNDLITDGTCNTEDRSEFYSCAGKIG